MVYAPLRFPWGIEFGTTMCPKVLLPPFHMILFWSGYVLPLEGVDTKIVAMSFQAEYRWT